MAAKTETGNRELRKWLAGEKERSESVDRMLLAESRQHRALKKRTRIGRFVIRR